MYLEICLITALLVAIAHIALPRLRASLTPPPARHRRDRYSVEAIRTRIEHETCVQPKPPPSQAGRRDGAVKVFVNHMGSIDNIQIAKGLSGADAMLKRA